MQKEIVQGFRLSSQQEHLWLQQRGDARAYFAHLAILIEGRIDTVRLEAALQKIVDQNEILRTAFHCLPSPEVPLQVIAAEMNLPMDLIDSDSLDREDRQSAISRVLNHAAADVPPDFTALPLVRASFLRLSATEGLLALRLPALCSDVAGLENLMSRISRSYAEVSTGEDSTDEPVQYADLSEWQHEMLLGELDENVRQFWQKPEYSLLSDLSLPFELRPSGDKPFSPASLTRIMGSDIASAIDEIATRHETSVSVFLLSCWQSLLYRLMRRKRIMVGACYEGRNYEELKYSLGIFARYLPMQVDMDGGASFIELLAHLDCLVEECGEFQEYFSWNGIARSDEDAAPGFFPICFDFHAQPLKYSDGGATFSIIERRALIDRFRTRLSCIEQDGSLILSYDYDPEFFYESDMARLADGFRSLVESVIANPSTPIDRLQILDHTAAARLLVNYNLTHCERQSDKPVHHLFESWAESVPSRMAVRYEEDSLSYDSLNRRANQLAHYLIGNGVGPDACVAIGLERSLEIVVSLLAILKAGGAYMPLDMGHPKQRLTAMVEEAQAKYIVTRQVLLDLLPEGSQKVICLDSDWPEISRLSEENPPARAVLDNLAYVLFTSGSTGKPKGVAIEHAQLANYVNGILPILQLPDGASFALVSTFSADLGNTVIFPSLCSGGSLHVLSQECAYDPESLAAYFDRHAIDCLKIVPSHLNALLAANSPDRVLPRRRLILGGEASRWDWVEQLPLGPACSVMNHYGPTETTVGVLTADIDNSARDPRSNTLPPGKPIRNARVYVLDEHLQPVPVYTTGEIYISGEGLARGYINRADDTAEKFLPDPYSEKSGARMYRTGDLGRHLEGGEIEFQGRADHQVKLRGYRIELGEIEAAIAAHPMVSEVVTMIRSDGPGDHRLVAYVVPELKPGKRLSLNKADQTGEPTSNPAGRAPVTSELQSYLRERLPDYMMPSAFVFLDRLPLNRNGKLDREALPHPEKIRPELEAVYVPPRTIIEQTIASVWQEMLGVDSVGVNDNFFDLGGNSLMMIQAHGKLRDALKRDMTVLDLFRYPTISALSDHLTKGETQSSGSRPEEDMTARLEAGKSRLLKQLQRSQTASRENDE